MFDRPNIYDIDSNNVQCLQDEFDDLGEEMVPEDGKVWSIEKNSVFAQRKRQCESEAVLNTDKVGPS